MASPGSFCGDRQSQNRLIASWMSDPLFNIDQLTIAGCPPSPPEALAAVEVRLVPQDDVEERIVDFEGVVVLDEPEFPKLVHEETHPGSRRPDHFGQGFLRSSGASFFCAMYCSPLYEQGFDTGRD